LQAFGAVRADPDVVIAGFDDGLFVEADEAERFAVEVEADLPGLAGFEGEAFEALEFARGGVTERTRSRT